MTNLLLSVALLLVGSPVVVAERDATGRPNEMGAVLILEYHDFKAVDERWARSWDSFQRDLESLYAKGYRPVPLRAYIKGDLALPAGTSPVIFTFDDGTEGQLRLIRRNGEWGADPQSAVGMMLQFQAVHPDFHATGTFYVNFNPVPFGEEATWKEKVRFLVAHGFEIANHSEHHEDLSRLTDDEVRRTLGMQVIRMRAVLPDYDGYTLALPFGVWPRDHALAISGRYDGVVYNHRAIMLVGADPAPSPYDRRRDLMALPRVQAIDSEFDRWMGWLDRHRYVSDGDPDRITIAEGAAPYLNRALVKGRRVRTYK